MDDKRRIVVVGAGPGGYVAAIRAAQLGAKVTLIERKYLGGTCLNIGCIPTKALLHTAELLQEFKGAPAVGINAEKVSLDFSKAMDYKSAVSGKLTGGVGALMNMNGVEVVYGEAFFRAPGKLRVRLTDGTEQDVAADRIILATGSENAIPPIDGIKDNDACINSTGALSLDHVPASMVVIGGGVIGMELGCAYAAFGTKVTIVEALDHILPMLDGELTKIGVRHMKKMGVKFSLSSPVKRIEKSDIGARVICEKKGKELVFEAEKVLVAVGRRASTESLNLEAGNINNDRGRIIVDDHMATNIPGVYAIGDCVYGHAMLAHTASVMGETAAENCMDISSVYDEKSCPTCVYMMPEAASVGITEEEAMKQGIAYKTGHFPMSANGKAIILNGGEGLVKIITDEKGKIAGMHIIGPRATDLISEGALAIQMGATADDIISTIHSHPTVSECVREAALNTEGRALNGPN